MRSLILLLLSFSAFVSSAKIVLQPRADTNDFLVRLVFYISEEKVPDYLVNVIYDRPTEKEVTSESVLEIFQTDNLTLETTYEILQALNIPSSEVFSLNGLNHTLEALNWSFTSFYNSITTNLGLMGTPLRDALLALQIDVTNFSSGITWGDPDPWSEFIKGTFTQETISQATEAAGITEDELFAGVKNIIAHEVASWEIENFIKLLVDHSIRQPEAVTIWSTLNITLEDVYNVELFKNILGNFSERINSQPSLGVLANDNNIYIHRKSYELFENEVDLISIHAETLVTQSVVTIHNINDTIYQNIVVLTHDDLEDATELTTIDTGYANEDLTDCEYITLQNNALFSVSVEEATFTNESFTIPRNTVNNVILGSPLVCNDTVYGLARELVGQTIVLDAFEDFDSDPDSESNNATRHRFEYLNAFVLCIVWALTQVFRC